MKCIICQSEIPRGKGGRGSSITCSDKCGTIRRKQRYLEWKINFPYYAGHGLEHATVGLISEYIVITELLARDLYVFKACTFNCPNDLVVISKDYKKVVLVEVKTGWLNKKGFLYYSKPSNHHYDVLAIVLKDSIIYKPDSFWDKFNE